jgi:mRNA interferase MazF
LAYDRHAKAIKWFGLQTAINEKFIPGKGHFFPRKAIVTVLLGENIGFEKSGSARPAICVSNDTNNQFSGNIIIVPLTDDTNKTGKGKKLTKTQYRLLKSKYPKLKCDSIVQCEDIRVVSKSRVGDVIDFVHPDDMKEIEKRLKTLLDL